MTFCVSHQKRLDDDVTVDGNQLELDHDTRNEQAALELRNSSEATKMGEL